MKSKGPDRRVVTLMIVGLFPEEIATPRRLVGHG